MYPIILYFYTYTYVCVHIYIIYKFYVYYILQCKDEKAKERGKAPIVHSEAKRI